MPHAGSWVAKLLRVHFRGRVLALLALISLGLSTALSAHAAVRPRPRARPRVRCHVPNVRGQKLAAAVKRLRMAHCAAAHARASRTTEVVGQRPVAGHLERGGARVTLFLGARIKTTPPHRVPPRQTPPHKTPPPAQPVLAGTPASATPEPVGIPGSWKLMMNSDFSTNSMNSSLWRTGWSSIGVSPPANANELDCYNPRNVYLPGDGTLHLDVTAVSSTCGGSTKPYTGAMVTTNPARARSGGFQYVYGVLEARIFLPADGSLFADWPAFWADGQHWPQDGEDDVMEGIYGMPCWTFHNLAGMVHACMHTMTPGWHTFASDWQPGSITYYYDGVTVGTDTSGITSSPMYIILDNTVHNNEPTVTVADSMQVQYVRVWQAG